MSTVIKGSASGQINLNDTTGSIQLNGSDVLTIDSSGNLTAPNNITVNGNLVTDTNTFYVDATNNRVGIGTSSPVSPLSVSGTSSLGVDQTDYIDVRGGGGTARVEATGSNTNVNLSFATKGNGATYFWQNGYGGTERMRIDANGRVLIGRAGALSSGKFQTYANSGHVHQIYYDYSSGTGYFIEFLRTTGGFASVAAVVGNITASTTTTSYNTSSDYRLKQNVAPMSGSIDRLKQLKPSTWSWVQDGSHGEGFLAHEAQEVIPEAVNGIKDGMRTEEYEVTPAVTDDEGNVTTAAVMGTREVPAYQGIDQSKLVPLLTSALQEAITKIENLETRIQALESA